MKMKVCTNVYPTPELKGFCFVYVDFEEVTIAPSDENKVQVIVSRDELKYIYTNVIRRANRDAIKFAKVHGGEGNKLKIALNIDGIPIWPSLNQWHRALKNHVF
jgi:hypothetical protein